MALLAKTPDGRESTSTVAHSVVVPWLLPTHSPTGSTVLVLLLLTACVGGRYLLSGKTHHQLLTAAGSGLLWLPLFLGTPAFWLRGCKENLA